MGNKAMFGLTSESGRSVNTTGNHPCLAKILSSASENSSKPSSVNKNNFPSKARNGDFVLSSLEKESINNLFLSCGILSQTTENISSLEDSAKSLSLVTNILCSI
jgi:hypothetical protein